MGQPILANSGIKEADLLKFPKFRRNQDKILIEYSDCIIQANDIADFQILIDDDAERNEALLQHSESHQSLRLLRGVAVGKQTSKSFNSLFVQDQKTGKLLSR